MLKFKSITYGRDGEGKKFVSITVLDGKTMRLLTLTKADCADILKALIASFGVKLAFEK